ncbi:hypothetical protein EsVE80_25320 [Enterococcus saigonensis]|uniref:Uncharacterized protein n=1 Tax=Enterococcus saigonensis TaxID=1805431 RepID=A0A679IF20_9ENTE|nr:hypothetical protein EsVE80_25320 [Enterococcus saigonensis]
MINKKASILLWRFHFTKKAAMIKKSSTGTQKMRPLIRSIQNTPIKDLIFSTVKF